MSDEQFDRRTFFFFLGVAGMLIGLSKLMPDYVYAGVNTATYGGARELSGNIINLNIGETPFSIGKETGNAVTVNGTLPAPLIRLKEGEDLKVFYERLKMMR